MSEEIKINCPACGAPVTSEICPYCGAMTGLDTASADMEYPVLECKEAHMNFWNITFPLIFAFGFGFFGFAFPVIFSVAGKGFDTMATVICIPFAVIAVVSLVIVLKNLYYALSVKSMGEEMEGTVYGYMDDTLLLNDRPAQICKILLHTSKGPRFILYKLHDTTHPYGINDRINIKVYKNRFAVIKNKERI
ncbi:MAG: zinc ribbon domain-containing protein [Lachnospiraceae bacterium]|nr:zinc ribbon domain-containing protein [Lachnospiraceae bacterium]